jgi:NAD(P)-dependent dehydrogenase (short-subunit alcohol dehydrogenase family)
MGNTLSAIAIAEEMEHQHGPGALAGQVVIITGANSGIGLGILKAMAILKPKIFVAARNRAKCEAVIEQVKNDSGNVDIHFLEVNFGSFESVRKAVQEFKSFDIPLHFLFNNAGAVFTSYTEIENGLEMTLRKGFRSHLLCLINLHRNESLWTCFVC